MKRNTRQLVILACALMFFYGFFLGGTQLVITDVAAEFGIGTAGMGMLVSAQYAAAVISPIVAGILADRFGKKPLLVIFSTLFGLGCTLMGLSPALGVYIMGACLTGAGYSVCESLSSAVLSDMGGDLGMRCINLSQGLLSVGAVVSPIILRWAVMHLGVQWRMLFFLCAAAFLLLSISLSFARFPDAVRTQRSSNGNSRFFTTAVFLSLFTSIVLYVGLENGFGYFVGTLFDSHTSWPPGLSAYGISAYWLGMALARMACSLRSYHPGRMLCACFSVIAVLFILLPVQGNNITAILLCGLIGIAYGPVWSTLVATAASRFPEQSAAVIGVMSTGCGLGGVIYPTVIGLMAEKITLHAAFWMLAATAAGGALLCTTGLKTHSTNHQRRFPI